ncbi:MAG: hypothetical protein HOV80_33745 [Polyangiaceae bacterium]|nr:hypothetical protein [Polyangiaceae bacterium]
MLTIPARRDRFRFGVLPWAAGALLLLIVVVLWSSSSSKKAPPAGTPTQDRSAAAPPAEREADVGPTGKKAAPAASDKPSKQDQAPPADERPERPAPPNPDDPAVAAVIAAARDDSPKGTQTLIASLKSSDEVVVAEAASALVDRRATEAIKPLSEISLQTAAGSGLSIIDALGRLGAVAGEDDKSVAVDRLLAMLAEEKARGARESPGNLLQIYEALGQTKDPKAAPALEAELLDESVPRAPKVVIVGAIVAIGQASSRDALEKAHAEQSAGRGADDFEEEIRVELVGVIAKALEVL